MANNLVLTGASFDTTGQKFGVSALSGGYGVAPIGLPSGTPWAIGLWFKLNSVPTAVQVMAGATQLFWLGFNANGTLHGEYGGKSGGGAAVSVNSSGAPSTGTWHFATLSLSTTTLTLTLDGVLIGTASISSTSGRYDTAGDGSGHATGYLVVRSHGGYETAATFQFNAGELDDVSLWSLDKYPIAFTVPTLAYTGAEPGLQALWRLDGNGNDSTLQSATAYSLTGPSSGTVNQPSPIFTVTANGATSAAITITPSDAGGGGSFSPPSITLAAGSSPSATFAYTAASGGAKTVSTTNAGSLTNPAPITYIAATSTTTIAPSDPGIVYSPGVWLVGSGTAKTVNAGAYFRTIFTGSQCSLTFDTSSNSTPLPQLYYRVDGVVWNQVTLASTMPLSMPSSTALWPRHYLEVMVKSTSEFLNFGANQGGSRWSPQNTAVVLTSLALAAGQSTSAPSTIGQSIWFFGDSITEGYHTVSSAGAGSQDTDGSDAMIGWAFRQRDLLGAEVAVIGFGGTGIGTAGVLGVPGLTASYNQLWAGQPRSFTPAPDLIVVAYGENDGTSTGDTTFIANYKAVLTGLLAATPAVTKVACMVPFSQRKAADIATAVAQVSSQRVTKIDTNGMFSTADSVDGQHPLGIANLGAIGPAIAAKLRPLLQGVRNRWVRS